MESEEDDGVELKPKQISIFVFGEKQTGKTSLLNAFISLPSGLGGGALLSNNSLEIIDQHGNAFLITEISSLSDLITATALRNDAFVITLVDLAATTLLTNDPTTWNTFANQLESRLLNIKSRISSKMILVGTKADLILSKAQQQQLNSQQLEQQQNLSNYQFIRSRDRTNSSSSINNPVQSSYLPTQRSISIHSSLNTNLKRIANSARLQGYMETSSKTGFNVEKVLELAVHHAQSSSLIQEINSFNTSIHLSNSYFDNSDNDKSHQRQRIRPIKLSNNSSNSFRQKEIYYHTSCF